jgi:hypothetical protein
MGGEPKDKAATQSPPLTGATLLTAMSKIDHAFDLRKRGFKIFPTWNPFEPGVDDPPEEKASKKGGKRPHIKNWPRNATTCAEALYAGGRSGRSPTSASTATS